MRARGRLALTVVFLLALLPLLGGCGKESDDASPADRPAETDPPQRSTPPASDSDPAGKTEAAGTIKGTNVTLPNADFNPDQGTLALYSGESWGFNPSLLIFLFLILVVRPVVMSLIRPRVAEQEMDEVTGLPEAEQRLALEESEVDEELLDTSMRLENAKNMALQLFEENMDQAVRLLKTWIRQEA